MKGGNIPQWPSTPDAGKPRTKAGIKKKMPVNVNNFDQCVNVLNNGQFQIEMDNVASMKDTSISSTEQEPVQAESMRPSYLRTKADSQGSVFSLKESPDARLLTESHVCIYEECMKFHSSVQKDPDSPASPLKDVFFYLVLILLIVWVLLYTVLSKMNYL